MYIRQRDDIRKPEVATGLLFSAPLPLPPPPQWEDNKMRSRGSLKWKANTVVKKKGEPYPPSIHRNKQRERGGGGTKMSMEERRRQCNCYFYFFFMDVKWMNGISITGWLGALRLGKKKNWQQWPTGGGCRVSFTMAHLTLPSFHHSHNVVSAGWWESRRCQIGQRQFSHPTTPERIWIKLHTSIIHKL